MRPNIDYRFWILLSWYISLQCITATHQQTRATNGKVNGISKHQPHRQIADNKGAEGPPDSRMYMNGKNVSSYHHPSRTRDEYHFNRNISRVPLTTSSISNHNNDAKQSVSYRIAEAQQKPQKIDVKFDNDNAEGGGDKEFHTIDDDTENSVYLNDLRNNINERPEKNHRRHRRSHSASSTNQYSNHTDVTSEQEKQQISKFTNHPQKQLPVQSPVVAVDEPAAPSSSSSPSSSAAESSLSSISSSSSAVVGAAAAASASASLAIISAMPTPLPSPSVSFHVDNTLNTNSALVKSNKQLDSTTFKGQVMEQIPFSHRNSTLTLDDINSNKNSTGTRGNRYELDLPDSKNSNSNEQIIIISNGDDDGGDIIGGGDGRRNGEVGGDDEGRGGIVGDDEVDDVISLNSDNGASDSDAEDDIMLGDEPRVLPLRPIIRGPYDDVEDHKEEMSVVYAEPHTEVKLNCDVDLDVIRTVWMKDGQMVHTTDRNSRPTDNRFIREPRGGLTITNAMLEDDGKWQCEAENARGYVENARPVKLVILDRPKPPYLLIDSRRLDAGNIFVPVKENSELSLACISEGGNPKPTLSWEVLLSPGVDRHAQKVAAEVLELQEVKSEKDKDSYKSTGAKSEARMPAVYRAHHNARILCVMEHPTLKMRQNASLLLDVQYTPSFAISRTPGFGYPLREGIEVSLKCDVDSNPPSTPLWQKDDGDTPVPQNGDGFLNFTSIRREHSGWYKCTSRHLNFQYSSIGYYLSVRYDSVDVTSEPLEQDMSVAASHNPNKRPQLEVQLGGAVTLQCPQGSLGCWSHLDPVSARLRGLGMGLTTPTGQFSLKDVVYQDAGVYKCIGQSPTNKKKLEVLHTVGLQVKGAPTVTARNHTPVAYPGSPLHLSVEFCANPPAFAARWLHGDRIYTPGNQYGIDVLAYGVNDLPTPYCKEARLTYVHMHERVPRTFYFVVSSPGGVAETIFQVNFTLKHKVMSNSIDEDEEELSEPEEIHFPVFGSSSNRNCIYCKLLILLMCFIKCIISVL